jgi:hypothetical protein
MFYSNTIQETRQRFFNSWEKYKQKEPLLPLEHELVQVILDHPEYHQTLENYEQFQQHTYLPELGETNPFLHMGLHLAIREQVATNRPDGINELYKKLVQKYKNSLTVEHLMMDHLAELLWQSQKNNLIPDEQSYLAQLAIL